MSSSYIIIPESNKLVVSICSNTETSLAMSMHPCDMVPRCPVSRCQSLSRQSPQFWWSRDVRSCVFSRPSRTQTACKR